MINSYLFLIQGECGACWASAAVGSVEASAARREGYMAYVDATTEGGNSTSDKDAIAYAQEVEKGAFSSLYLSVQELVDCDSMEQGCTGGNPLLAFFFIHRYGLTNWSSYPYQVSKGTCRWDVVSNPIATVSSWGIISSNREDHMELALQYIGPIAVGFNGGDPSFLAYQSGIFDNPICRKKADHALLIVGYGQDESEDGEITKYWIARNSWGQSWGENGYVRIKRGDPLLGKHGVCGISRSPSVALGGSFLARERGSGVGANPAMGQHSVEQIRAHPHACDHLAYPFDRYCLRMENFFGSHKALVLGILGILVALLASWPLSYDFRRRRRRYRLRMAKLAEEQRKKEEERRSGGESSPLLEETRGTAYGL